MPSLKARALIFLLQNRHWFRGQWRRPVVDRATSIQELRDQVEASSSKFGKLPDSIEVCATGAEHPYSEWIRPRSSTADSAILYFHGGGYVMGSAHSHRNIVAKLVEGSGVPAWLFSYRLAPEFPFPAALEDSLAAYQELLATGVFPSRIVFVGDSAGAGLCLATLLALKDRRSKLPAAAAVLSPWTDLLCSGDSYQRRDPLAPDGSWQIFGSYYVGDQDPGQPYISPLYGELAGLPPLYISVGENESMLDDSTVFAARAQEAGVEVTLKVGAGMVHCYPVLSPLFVEAREAMEDICRFIQAHAAPGPSKSL